MDFKFSLDPRILAIPPECFDDTILDFVNFDDSVLDLEFFGIHMIRQFSSPPPPASSPRRKPLQIKNVGSKSGTARRWLNDVEQRRVIQRVEKKKERSEEELQVRLSNIRKRNDEKYIASVKQRSDAMSDSILQERLEGLISAESRRNEILLRTQNTVLLRNTHRFVEKAEMWVTIVVTYLFITEIIKAKKVREALEVMRKIFRPILHKRVMFARQRKEEEAFVSRLPEMPYPTAEVILSMKGLFFSGWPPTLLEMLASKATRKYVKKGRFLIHAGNHDRSMFMITLGTVSIVFRKKNSSDKRRLKENSAHTLLLESPCYVGEYGLVCKETRTASVYCETDILAWCVTPHAYEQVAQFLSPELAKQNRNVADLRRKQNLKKLFSLRVEDLRDRVPFFRSFSDAAVKRIINDVEPIVLHNGETLYQEGDLNPDAYFLQEGCIMERDAEGNERTVSKGAVIGIFECACCVNEKKKATALSVDDCDIWRLPRESLLDIGMTEPQALIECRREAKLFRAKEIKKNSTVPWFFRYDPYLSFCFLQSHILKIYRVSEPTVFVNGETLVEMGAPVSCWITILKGSVDVAISTPNGREVFRMTANFSAEADENEGKEKRAAVPGMKGHSFVLGAYEYAASLPRYVCTVTSHGLTEALSTDLRLVNAIIPPELHKIIVEDVSAREVIRKAYQEQNFSIITSTKVPSFAQVFKPPKTKYSNFLKKSKT